MRENLGYGWEGWIVGLGVYLVVLKLSGGGEDIGILCSSEGEHQSWRTP